MKGKQIDIDKCQGQLTRCVLTADISLPCDQMFIVFNSPDKLEFHSDNENYITYKNIDWCPSTFKESRTQNGFWHYEMEAYPKPYFNVIKQPCTNTGTLASSMGLTLLEGSISLPVHFPIINEYAYQLVHEYRLQSLDYGYSKNNLGLGFFLYFNDKKLLSSTWKTITSQVAETLQEPSYRQGANITNYIDDTIQSVAISREPPKPWVEADYLLRMCGRKFQMDTATPAKFMKMYTMKFSDSDEYDFSTKFLCIRTTWDSSKTVPYQNLFSEINYVS